MKLATAFALTILCLQILNIFPAADAQLSNNWNGEYATSLTDTVSSLNMDHDGERIGLVYKYANSAKIGFSIRSTTGTWTQTTGDLTSGITSNPQNPKLVSFGGSNWAILLDELAGGQQGIHSFSTSNDGTSFVDNFAPTSLTPSTATSWDTLRVATGRLGIVVCSNAGDLVYDVATGNGVTWGTGFSIADNRGNPNVVGSVRHSCSGSPGVHAAGDGTVQVVWSDSSTVPTTNVYYVTSTGGGDQFWTVPYTSGSPCTSSSPACAPTDGSTNNLFIETSTISGNPTWSFGANHYNGAIMPTQVFTACTRQWSYPFTKNPQVFNQPQTTNTGCNANTGTAIVPMDSCTSNTVLDSPKISENANGVLVAPIPYSSTCSGNGLNVVFSTDGGSTWASTYTNPSLPTAVAVDQTAALTYVAFTDSGNAGQIKVIFASSPSSLSGTVTISVTGLTGFDVDTYGNFVIARTEGGNNVRTFSGADLGSSKGGIFPTPNCQLLDGVAALYSPLTTTANPTPHLQEFMSFVDCGNSMSTATTTLRIRDQALLPPPQPPICSSVNSGTETQTNPASGPFCSADILNNDCGLGCITNDNIPLPPALTQLGIINQAKWDWSNAGSQSCSVECAIPGTTIEHTTLSWAYSRSDTGNIGVFEDVQNLNNPDSASIVEDGMSSSGAPSQICTWTDATTANAQNHIAAVIPGVNTKSWIVTIGTSLSGIGLANKFFQATPGLSLENSFATVYNSANAIDCQNGLAAIQNLAGVWLIQFNAGRNRINGPLPTAGIHRGVALSHDLGIHGQFEAIVEPNNIISLFNATTGQVANGIGCQPNLQLPDTNANFVGMKFDLSAQELFAATRNSITRYDVHACTTGNPVPEGVVQLPGGKTQCIGTDGLNSTSCTGISDKSLSGLNGCGGVTTALCAVSANGPAIAGSGSGCNDIFTGSIVIGRTYIPLFGWTNCASMIFETILTCVLTTGAVLVFQYRFSRRGGTILPTSSFILSYFGSIYFWQAPLAPVLVFVAVGIGIGAIRNYAGRAAN